jgi:uncharacterized membrane protein YfcA
MQTHGVPSGRSLLIFLCCLVPLAALGATLFLHTPGALTGTIALLVLLPIAYRLLAET